MKKIAFLIIILIVLIIIRKPNIDSSTVFWTLQLSTFDNYINKVINNFGNGIKWIDIPYAEGEKRTLASILTDNPPDLINLTPDFSMLLAQKKALFEIPSNKLNEYNLKDALKYDDKYYGIPFYATSAVTLFNKSLMPDLKEFPRTYDELLKIKPPKNTYITMISFSENDTLLKILNKYDINSCEKINSQKSIELFELFKYAYDNKYIPVESVTQSHRDALEKYMAGKLVFLVTGTNFLNMIKENAPGIYKNTVILPQLTGSTGKYDFSLMNFIIPKKAANKERALDFALYLTNKENQLEFSKLASVLPANNQALNNEYFKKEQKDIETQARIISASQLNNIQPPLANIRNKKDLNILSSQTIQEILINNEDIKNSLEKFKQEWQKLENI